MEKNYNYQRRKLMLPEYGRHIHEMVDYLMTIQDRDLRNNQAQVVIEVMGNLNPVLRDTADFAHKLWDHLFIMSDFQIDVDSPYPRPATTLRAPKPDKMSYPNKRITHKQYGQNIRHMLLALERIPDTEARMELAVNIAKYMRAKSFEYNQEYPNNEVILKDIHKISKGRISLDENTLNNIKIDYKQPQSSYRVRKTYNQNGSHSTKMAPRQNKQNGKRRANFRTPYHNGK